MSSVPGLQWRASPRSSPGPPPAAGCAGSGPPPLPQPEHKTIPYRFYYTEHGTGIILTVTVHIL